jgi:hypothetical protein
MDKIVLSGFSQQFMTVWRQRMIENSAIFIIFVYKRQNFKAIPAYSAQLF